MPKIGPDLRFLTRIKQTKRKDLNTQENRIRKLDEISNTIRRVMITIVVYSLFCLLTLGAPDYSLIAPGATIKIPFADTDVSYTAFIIVGPLILVGLLIYLHIFIGKLLSLKTTDNNSALPFIFNMPERTPRILSHFLFYWLVPVVLLAFEWKAAPRWFSVEANALGILSWFTLSMLLVLGLRRSKWLPISTYWRTLIVIVVIVLAVPITIIATFYSIDNSRNYSMGFFMIWLGAISSFLYGIIYYPNLFLDILRQEETQVTLFFWFTSITLITLGLLLTTPAFKRRLKFYAVVTLMLIIVIYIIFVAGNLIEWEFNLYLEDYWLGVGVVVCTVLTILLTLKLRRVEWSPTHTLWRRSIIAIIALIVPIIIFNISSLLVGNYRHLELAKADLAGFDLTMYFFKNANLSEANLENTNLQWAVLENASLIGANLSGANLENASLIGANLKGANLEKTNLQKANLTRTQLQRRNFSGFNLQGVVLDGAQLQEANLSDTNLIAASLIGANLKGANLKGASLINANLKSTDLTGANLEEINFENLLSIEHALISEDASQPFKNWALENDATTDPDEYKMRIPGYIYMDQ